MATLDAAAQDPRPSLTDAEEAIATVLRHLGLDPAHGDLRDTPRRVVAALGELTRGYAMSPAEILKTFACDSDELVLVRDIEFTSLCEHHVLPFSGVVHVAYLPSSSVLGLSKIPRLVQCFAARLQMQERMTREIATALATSELAPRGVAVVVEGSHTCCSSRGIRSSRSSMVTSCMLGRFRESDAARAEVLGLLRTLGR
jgi:GTP cyclohydrolase I